MPYYESQTNSKGGLTVKQQKDIAEAFTRDSIKRSIEEKKLLHLTLNKKWFDMILSGEKTEEYREIKPYWTRRFTYKSNIPNAFKFFDKVRFVNGYGADKPAFVAELNGIVIGSGKSEWGADPGEQYYVLEIGRILHKENIKG